MIVGDIIQEVIELDLEEAYEWSDNFTGYYEGVLDESDGYLEDPNTLYNHNLSINNIVDK